MSRLTSASRAKSSSTSGSRPRPQRFTNDEANLTTPRTLTPEGRGDNSGNPALETHMTKPDISSIAPFFIVKDVPAALSFYRDRLGFDITFQGPDPDDIFFGIVQRGRAMIMFKDVGVDPVPNYTRDVKKGIARWDAYLHVLDSDALAAEFSSRDVEFSEPLKDTGDGLRGFELKDADGYVLFFGRPRS